MKDFDAIVIGGGPGGATAALLLARAGWSVALIEQALFPRKKVCGEYLSATNLPLLERLGVARAFLELAGPEVRRVGLFAGRDALTAEMPATDAGGGRALGREHLDTLMLDRAAAAGARIWQPWSAEALVKEGQQYICRAVSLKTRESLALRSPIVIAAHGSWFSGSSGSPGALLTQVPRAISRPSDLFGFKARFAECRLPAGLMPLLAFPGGYGGMVHTDHGQVSLSCCIRRDQLDRARHATGLSAADAVLAHIRNSSDAVRESLAGARLDDRWRSAGPIRPGIRSCGDAGVSGVFLVGNAAGEAHPVVAEGIGMAMQSAWLLCERLTAPCHDSLDEVARDYSAAWRKQFAPRIHAAAIIARWAMSPAAIRYTLPLLRVLPYTLTAGARLTGKVKSLPV